jgi:hypothetical protein
MMRVFVRPAALCEADAAELSAEDDSSSDFALTMQSPSDPCVVLSSDTKNAGHPEAVASQNRSQARLVKNQVCRQNTYLYLHLDVLDML